MKCSKCGSELNQGAKFCSSCGAKVENPVAYCSNCGTKLDPTAKFCPECGTKVETQKIDVAEEELPAKSEEKVSDQWIYVNIADEGLFGTCGYWKDGQPVEFPQKEYPETFFSITAVLKDAKAEAENVLGVKIGKVVMGIPDIISYADLCRYRKAADDAGYISYQFMRTTVAQGFAISKEMVFDEKNNDGLNFGIYNFVNGLLIGTAFESCDGVVEVKYSRFNGQDKNRDFLDTFCRKEQGLLRSWNKREEQDIEQTIIFLNENCDELKSFLIDADGADKEYFEIKKGTITNKGLALKAALLSGQIKDLLVLDTMPFMCSIKIVEGESDFFGQNIGQHETPYFGFHKQTTIPCKCNYTFQKVIGREPTSDGFTTLHCEDCPVTTWENNQSSISFEIFMPSDENKYEETSFYKDTKLIFTLDGIPPAPAGLPKIEFSAYVSVNLDMFITGKVVGTDIEKTMQF